jgi:MOSC domain-containing protein YiiM
VQLLSVNVGLPREVAWNGETVLTSIWKQPVEGRVRVVGNNLEGDRQSDLSAHGGPDKAVYVYPSEHYAYWRERLPGMELPWGVFGENLSVAGLTEDQVRVGDRLRIGTAEFAVTQPRLPCYKLGIRFGRPAMEKALLQSRRTGFYLSVAAEGEVGVGDEIALGPRPENSLTILELVELYTLEFEDRAQIQRAAELPGLSAAWRRHFERRLRD